MGKKVKVKLAMNKYETNMDQNLTKIGPKLQENWPNITQKLDKIGQN